MRIPGTKPRRGVPHYTNYRRLPAYEQATGLNVKGDHALLVDWLLAAVCRDICPYCDQLGVLAQHGLDCTVERLEVFAHQCAAMSGIWDPTQPTDMCACRGFTRNAQQSLG